MRDSNELPTSFKSPNCDHCTEGTQSHGRSGCYDADIAGVRGHVGDGEVSGGGRQLCPGSSVQGCDVDDVAGDDSIAVGQRRWLPGDPYAVSIHGTYTWRLRGNTRNCNWVKN